MIEVILYKNKSEKIVLNKDIEEVKRYDISMLDTFDIKAPVININEELDIDNESYYIHIPAFNRYYYLTGKEMFNKDLWSYSTKCDLLMSRKEKLMEQEGIVIRNREVYNLYLNDSFFKTEADNILCGRKFSGEFPDLNYFMLLAN